MNILKLTSFDRTRKDRSIWVNLDYVAYIKNRHTVTGEKLKGATIELLGDVTVDVTESAEDIIKTLSAMDNKDYNRGVGE